LWGDGNNQLPIVLTDDVADAMARGYRVPGIEAVLQPRQCPCITANEYLDELERRAGIEVAARTYTGWRYYTEALAKWAIKSIGHDPNAVFPSYADFEVAAPCLTPLRPSVSWAGPS